MKPDWYEWRALLPAALLTAMPVFLLWAVLPANREIAQLTGIFTAKIVGVGVVVIMTMYPGTQIVRWLGVWLVQRPLYGEYGIKFPSQIMLLLTDNELDATYKKRVRDKLSARYSTRLATEQDEIRDLGAALKILQGVVRSANKEFGDDPMVRRANAAYGFARSFVGGAYLGVAMSLAGIGWLMLRGSSPFVTHLMVLVAIGFVLVIMLEKYMVTAAAHRYASALFSAILAAV